MNHKKNIITRQGEMADLKGIVELHLRNFNNNELSIILGKKPIETFYKKILQNKNTSLKIVEKNGTIRALSIAFFKYTEFEREYKKTATKALIKLLAKNVLNIKKILFITKTVISRNIIKKNIPNEIYDYHIGSIIIDKNSRDDINITKKFFCIYEENLKSLSQANKHYWGSCRISNKAPLRISKKYGMRNITEIKSYPENIYIMTNKNTNRINND